jgi:transcriptional regulator with XRE-family HTH domain
LKEIIEIPRCLETRRKSLRMSKKILAHRSGISLPTVNRILCGREKRLTVDSVQALAKALGVVIRLGASVACEEVENAFEFREKQAKAKAKRLVRMVQATMALESQAVENTVLEQMEKQTACELLAGSTRRLWSD